MRLLALLVLAGAAATFPLPAQSHREAGAHEHGRGALNIAVEGNKVTMELEVPGADIVGFEHAAKSRRDKAAVEKAKAQLMAPLTLFKLPAAADCRVSEAKVEVEGDGHDHNAHDHKAKEGAKHATGKAKKEEGEAHSEFHAQYVLECGSASSITTIEFAYFNAFARARKLEVNMSTAKGQNKFEVTRKKPSISLAGMI